MSHHKQPPSLTISSHALTRFLTRTNGEIPPGDITESKIQELWEESIPVGYAEDTNANVRLHPPLQILFLETSGVVTTILNRGDVELNTEHLQRCSICDYHIDPEDSGCRWCLNSSPL